MITNFFKLLGSSIRRLTLWVLGAVSEEEGGKLSIGRVIGLYTVYHIIELGMAQKIVPDLFERVFMYSIGYSLLSKALSSVSPAILDIAKAMLLKVQGASAPKEQP